MAKNIGLVGGFVGRFGNAVGYTNRGRQLIRVYQPKVYNPNTKRQQLTRNRFKVLNSYARALSTPIGIGFNRVLAGFTRQAFIGNNMDLSRYEHPSDESPRLESLQFSDGPLAPPMSSTPQVSGGNSVSVAISAEDSSIGYDADGTPMYVGVVVVAVNESAIGSSLVSSVVTATEMGSEVSTVPTSVSFSVPGSWSGSSIYVYAFFKQSAVPLNGIPASEWPWRTPFNASPTRFMGTAEII